MKRVRLRSALAFGLSLLVSASCGPSKSTKTGPRPPQLSRTLGPTDLLPKDLDVVVRVDVGRVLSGLGIAVIDNLAQHASQNGGDAFVAEAIAKAETVWIGTRLADFEAGDYVIVAEGRLGEVHIDKSDWVETTPAATIEGVHVLDRVSASGAARATPLARNAVGRIIVANSKLYAFVSPAEVDATSRLLRDGPDEGHVDPDAVGLVSADIRGHRLPLSLEKKYPSIAGVIAGVARIKGAASLAGDGVKISFVIHAKHVEAAKKVERFLSTFRESALETKYSAIATTATVEQIEADVHVDLTVPAEVVVAALRD